MHKRLAHSVWGALEYNTLVNQHSDSALLKVKSSSFIALSRRRIFAYQPASIIVSYAKFLF